ncbi:MAG: histidinol-phosphate transaminase [Porphyromonadaceae bacterium CG2_30_38_12]|nr:MAG: histidinol-phosphate transaminase [Porphyromonadaceae bacterium CG2_30_38_12]
MKLNEILRKNILSLQPYSCARDEFKGEASVYLDANESPFNNDVNRYPDPLQLKLKKRISELKNVPVDNIFLGNGSDEAIDLLYRAFCEPNVDNVVAMEPSYGMYKVSAAINDIDYRKVLLNEKFDIDAYKLIDASNIHTKIIWLCSPNNPTGNKLSRAEIIKTLQWFRGIVVVDEAYIDFSAEDSLLSSLSEYTNLVVLQTLSKAWGQAAIRLGMAFASNEIIDVLNKIKYPYNINILTQRHALKVLMDTETLNKHVQIILAERNTLCKALSKIDMVKEIYKTDANFVLVRVADANMLYNWLVSSSIIVRNRSNIALCEGCLRITVGTAEDNSILLQALSQFSKVLK